jgi:hypothetical protein
VDSPLGNSITRDTPVGETFRSPGPPMVVCMREEVSATRGPRARIEPTVEALPVALHPLPDGRWVRHRGKRETSATLGRETGACQSPIGNIFSK